MAAAAAVAAGCTYRPGTEGPLARSLSWFSYAGANDIRDRCGPGARDTVRLIYNAQYDEQVRSYDVEALPGDGGAIVEVRVKSPMNLFTGLDTGDPEGPWRAKGNLVRLGPDALADLRRALDDSGLYHPPERRLRLGSQEYYWLAAACLDGRFYRNAWKFPSARFRVLSFPAVLLRHDPTGVPLRQPDPAHQYPGRTFERFIEDDFEFVLDGGRLIGGEALFGS